MSIVMHADVESKNVLPLKNNSLEYDNLDAELLKKENDRLLELIISQDLVHTALNTLAAIAHHRKMEQSYLDEYNENLELQAELSKKNDMVENVVYNELSNKCARMKNQYLFEINNLRAQLKAKNNSISKSKDHIATLKGKSVFVGDKYENISKVIAPGMYKLDLEPFSLKLLKNKESHVEYLKHTQEHVVTLREIVEQARALKPLDSDLDSALVQVNKVRN
ncbi:hypothetical protein Tco_1072253 [Tanacetum coccineum]